MVIITDSASDLPQEIKSAYGLKVIPTPVLIDGVDYLDGETLDAETFYRIQTEGKAQIKTYHINPDMFEQAFRPYAEAGEQVLYLCFSTGIAATYNAANLALETVREEYPDFDLTIVDSRCASAGFGLFVTYLLQLQARGAGKETLVEAAMFYREHIRHIFTVETLDYLIKGGRISKTKGGIAKTLDIKPILTVNKEGSLEIYKLVRGRKKSLSALVDFLLQEGDKPEAQTVAICHGAAPEAVDILLRHAGDRIQDTLISQVGCAIGAHTGKGIVGVCFLDAPDPYREYKGEE